MILFRLEAGPEIGFGHLMRCRSLAYALHEKGEECVMVGPNVAYATNEDREVFADWIPLPLWESAVEDAKRSKDYTL